LLSDNASKEARKILAIIQSHSHGTPEEDEGEYALVDGYIEMEAVAKEIREAILIEIRNDPVNTILGLPLPEVYRLILDAEAKSAR
jgi:hypothetical protein